MEMDSNPITKPSKKGTILSVAFYVLAVVLLLRLLLPWQPATKTFPGSLSRVSLCREMNWPL